MPHISAGAADLANDRVAFARARRGRRRIGADRPHVLHEAACRQRLEKHQRRAARQQVAAVRAAVIAGRDGGRDPLAEQRRADRHAGAEGLADGDQVGRQAEALVPERVRPCGRGRTAPRRR